MKKKIICIAIIGMFLMVGVSSSSASNSIKSSYILKEETLSPSPIQIIHVTGNVSDGFAFKFGTFLFAYSHSADNIRFEYYPKDDPDNVKTVTTKICWSWNFFGKVTKHGDGTFSFEGDAFKITYGI